MAELPSPRGALTRSLFDALRLRPHTLPAPPVLPAPDVLADEDLQLALYVCYELHYRGFDGVDEEWEWEPSLLALRARLEVPFEAALDAAAGERQPLDGRVEHALLAVAAEEGPSLSKFVQRQATHAQVQEFLVHRSAYQLKEADPHSFVIPRLEGPAKAALLEVQFDEYGAGRPERMHARLFADVLEAVGLDSAYGAYLDAIPGLTLATVNLISLFGLHRRLRGALCGHLALFEMESSIPNRRYGDGLRRLGYDTPAATRFFDEHVEADAVHEHLAASGVAGALVAAEPHLGPDVVWGARALAALERRWATALLDAWAAGTTFLRTSLQSMAEAA